MGTSHLEDYAMRGEIVWIVEQGRCAGHVLLEIVKPAWIDLPLVFNAVLLAF